MSSEDELYHWENGALGIWKYKKCEHDLVKESRLTRFGRRFWKGIGAVGTVVIGFSMITGDGVQAFGTGIASIPVIYVLSSDPALSVLSDVLNTESGNKPSEGGNSDE